MSIKEKPWWMLYPERKQADTKLFMFPYAGGAPNTFSQWSQRLPDSIEVAVIFLPGRMHKKEGAIYEWRELSSRIGDAIIEEVEKTGQRFAIYGHSFGALLAFLTTVYIREKSGLEPCAFMVGSKNSPQSFVKPDAGEKLIHDFSPAEMKAYYMKHFAHAAPAGFLDIPGMVESICAVLQVDLGINQKFWWDQLSKSEQRPLNCPIFAFHGENDDRATEDEMLTWEELTKGDFRFRQYGGNHFFIHEDQDCDEFLADVADFITEL